jgi:hypothetical protein
MKAAKCKNPFSYKLTMHQNKTLNMLLGLCPHLGFPISAALHRDKLLAQSLAKKKRKCAFFVLPLGLEPRTLSPDGYRGSLML